MDILFDGRYEENAGVWGHERVDKQMWKCDNVEM